MYQSLLSIAALLPLPAARCIGRWLGLLYYRFNKKRVHIARVNMRICFPEVDDAGREARVKNAMIHAGYWFMEAGPIWLWHRQRILRYVRLHNREVYDRAVAEGRGVILAIPHLGNWEVMGPVVTAEHPFACFYKHDPKRPDFSRFLRRQRSRNGTLMAPADNSGIRLLYKHLREGKVIGLLPDHNPSGRMAVFAPFFGRQALTGTLVSSLARKTGAPVLTAAAIRTDRGFEVHFARVEAQDSDDPLRAATALNQALEDCIRLAPEQFHWVYPRFRRRPDPRVQSPYRIADA